MAVPFKVMARRNPMKPDEPEKFYAAIQSDGKVDLREMAHDIAEITTISLPDVFGTLEALVMLIPKYTQNGRIVKLGEVGSLRVSGSSIGCEAEEEVNANKIKNTRYIFKPGKILKKALKSLEFVKTAKAK